MSAERQALSRRSDNCRRIHARTADHWLIVRYDRAGKWYAELEDERVPISFAQAVKYARRAGSYVYLGQPGGSRFDAAVRKVQSAEGAR